MRFHEGCWVKRKGVELFSPKEVHFFEVKDNILSVCAPTTPIRSRGDVLEGINLTICFSSPAPEIIRVQAKHHLGVTHKGPDFELNLPKKSCLNIEEKEDKFVLKSGELSLEVTKNPFSFFAKTEKYCNFAIEYDTYRHILLVRTIRHGVRDYLLDIFRRQRIPQLWYPQRTQRLYLARPQDAGDHLSACHHPVALRLESA